MQCSTFEQWELYYFVESKSEDCDWCVLCLGEKFPVPVGKSREDRLHHWKEYHKPVKSIFRTAFIELEE